MGKDYDTTCFIVMPFGTKIVGDREVDFDAVYESLIAPAVTRAQTPAGEALQPLRADGDFFSASIDLEMFEALEYSRIVLADITGLNANVFYELGARHRAHEFGTVIIRKEDAGIPFDINTIRVFSYAANDDEEIARSTELIARVLTESLEQQRPDSPVQLALQRQRNRPQLEALIADAEGQLRLGDNARAAALLLQAVEHDRNNPGLRLRAAVLLRDQGHFPNVVEQAAAAVQLSPRYAEAHRELGIAQNKLHVRNPAEHPESGEAALLTAIELNPHDYEALCNLGGIYKRQKRLSEALDRYDAALALSNGHPYPLLNALKLRYAIAPHSAITSIDRIRLGRARAFRESQARQVPSLDTPWCFFDLSDIALFLGEGSRALADLLAGVERATHWQITTHLDSLALLPQAFPGLEQATMMLRTGQNALNFDATTQ